MSILQLFPNSLRKVLAGLFLLCLVDPAWAQLKIEGTRLIYSGADREASINVVNRGSEDLVVQSWVSHQVDSNEIPFAIVQPLTILPARGRQLLRVLYEGKGLPTDKESMFWLNVLEVPRKAGDATSLQFAIRQRIKLFYRPKGLLGSASDALPTLQWRRHSQRIEVRNPSAFHLSLIDLALDGPGFHQYLMDYVMLEPGASIYLDTVSAAPVGSRISFTEIADSGLLQKHTVSLP